MPNPSTQKTATLELFGNVRGTFAEALRETATNLHRDSFLFTVVGSVAEKPSSDAANDLTQHTEASGQMIGQIFDTVQAFVTDGEDLLAKKDIVFIIDDKSALGDPSRPSDSSIANAIISYGRALTLEFARRSSTVTTILTSTIERVDTDVSDTAVLNQLRTIANEGVTSRGQEIFVGSTPNLGRQTP